MRPLNDYLAGDAATPASDTSTTPISRSSDARASDAACNVCHGHGWRWNDVVNIRVACSCDIGQAVYAEYRRGLEEQAARERREREQRAWDAAGIPPRFANVTLGPPLPPDLVNRLSGKAVGSWLLWGQAGRGKTSAAIAYGKRWMLGAGMQLLFRTTPDMLSELRATYDGSHELSEMEVIRYYRDVPLLILDDIGAEQLTGTGWAEDRLYQVINGRHGDMRPTVFTSNLAPPRLREWLGDRIYDRILEMADRHVVEVRGRNLRPAYRG